MHITVRKTQNLDEAIKKSDNHFLPQFKLFMCKCNTKRFKKLMGAAALLDILKYKISLGKVNITINSFFLHL